jgi:Mrr N-terminal domain
VSAAGGPARGSIPSQNQLTLPLLAVLEHGPLHATAAADALAQRIGLDPAERARTVLASTKPVNAWDRTVRWVQQKTRLSGLTERDDAGRWQLTPAARNALTPATPGIVVTVFETHTGVALRGEAEAVEGLFEPGSIDFVLVSPPYDLATAKRYGGRRGSAYEDWLIARPASWRSLLTPRARSCSPWATRGSQARPRHCSTKSACCSG